MKRLRKILRKVAWIFAGLLVLFLILHTPPVKSLFKGILTRSAGKQLNGRIEIGRLSYRLWQGDIRVEDVEFKLPGIQAKANRIEAGLFSKQGILLKVDQSEVILSPKPDSSEKKQDGGVPSQPWTFLEKLGAVEINNTRLDWRNDQTILSASGSLKLERQDENILGQRQSWILQADVNCSLSSRPPIPLKVSAELALDGESLRINPLQIDSNKNSFYTTGILHHMSPLNGELEGGLQIDSTLAVAINLNLPVKGAITAQFQLTAFDSDMEGQVELDSPGFILAETGPWTVNGNIYLRNRILHFERFQLKGYSGSLESQGRIDPGRGSGEVHLLAHGIDLNPLLKTWTETLPQIATRAGAKIDLSFDNWQFDQIRANGEIDLNASPENGLPFSGKAVIGFEKGVLSFRSESLQIFKGQCRIKGSLDTKGIKSSAELSIPASDLGKISKAFRMNLPQLKLDGLLSASGNLTGNYNDLAVSASVKSDDIQVNSEKLDLMANLEWRQNALRIRSARVNSGPGHLSIQGTIPLGKTIEEWDIAAKMESFDLSGYLERFGFSSSADGSFHITGPSSNPVWSMSFNSKLNILKHPSRTATVILIAQKKAQTIAIDELRIDAGGGFLTASGFYRTDSKEIKGQLTGFGIRIQEIFELPENLRHLEGVLSMDGDFSGTTQSPQSRLDLNLEDLSVNGVSLPTYLLGLRLEKNRIEFKGSGPEPFLTGFCDLVGSLPLHAELDLQPFPYNSLLSAIPKLHAFEDIEASGRIELDLSLKDFSNLKYFADIEEIKGTHNKRTGPSTPFPSMAIFCPSV